MCVPLMDRLARHMCYQRLSGCTVHRSYCRHFGLQSSDFDKVLHLNEFVVLIQCTVDALFISSFGVESIYNYDPAWVAA